MRKRIVVRGRTDSIITLNKTGIPIRGRTVAILNVGTEEQEREIMAMVRDGFIEIVDNDIQQPEPVIQITSSNNKQSEAKSEKKKGGRPKGSKNKTKNSFAEEEHTRVSKAEAETQKMGSKVIVATLDGPKVGRMTRSAINDITETEQTRASIEAMERLQEEDEEEINLPDPSVDESKLDVSERTGGKAVIATEGGVSSVNMVNSILPDAIANKKMDPFIDRKDKTEQKEQKEQKISTPTEDPDPFIEI